MRKGRPAIRARKERALERLEAQLERGTKPSEDGAVELTTKDKSRIKAEIKSLQGKI